MYNNKIKFLLASTCAHTVTHSAYPFQFSTLFILNFSHILSNIYPTISTNFLLPQLLNTIFQLPYFLLNQTSRYLETNIPTLFHVNSWMTQGSSKSSVRDATNCDQRTHQRRKIDDTFHPHFHDSLISP